MVNFDLINSRHHTESCKWDVPEHKAIVEHCNEEFIELGCADTDFKSPPEIIDELKSVLDKGIFGYTFVGDHFAKNVCQWFQKRHNTTLDPESIVYTPRINIACSLCVEAFTRPGDKIILNAPFYPPLYQASVDNGRFIVAPELKQENDRFVLDFDKLEKSVDDRTKMFIFVSPHNPTTRIWSKEELEQVADFCVRHNLILFVDEIHADFFSKGHKFISFAELSGPIEDQLIIANSPAKTFNVMGCIVAYLIIKNPKLRKAFSREMDRVGECNPNIFANALMKVAYTKCDYYIDDVNEYIDQNEAYLLEELPKIFPKAKIIPREGTYLLWVDFRDEFASEKEMMDFFINKAHVGVHEGSHFGASFAGFVRINMACPKATLERVIERFKRHQA